MYIGGKDEMAMHHLVNEVFDNAMDEAVAGHATRIEVELDQGNKVTIRDNGRGIPTDPHPKYPDKSALEVIFTTLHSGGKFHGKVYATSGGLHGVGVSVVNALSDHLEVEVVRDKQGYKQTYSKGHATSKLEQMGTVHNRKGTTISFTPDLTIFGDTSKFFPSKLYRLIRSKAYLYRGVEIRWKCAEELLDRESNIPAQEVIHFPGGLKDFLALDIGERRTITATSFIGEAKLADKMGHVEWAVAWPADEEGAGHMYCNTIETPEGGTHETGLRMALMRGVKAYGEMIGNKKINQVMADDVMGSAIIILSLFIKDPQFQGQTKEKLVSAEANKLTENAIRDHFDHWLSADTESGRALLNHIIERAGDRLSKRKQKEINRKTATQRLRLPGKLADCTRSNFKGTEIFLVEGDSAGGSAKQARNRETQAILPLRGKILNVASATNDKIRANQEITDMVTAFGCGTGKHFDLDAMRYEKVIIMTDADVDGAHIASLLMTFFYQEMRELIRDGRLYLAQPPLFRITQGSKTFYAQDEEEKHKIVDGLPKNKGKIDIGRFKGLGEMTAPQLKETTMNPNNRVLLRVMIDEEERSKTADRVEQLMGKKPELRFQFIQEQTALKGDMLSEQLDV
jgi:topoisomerase-4 subunit B